MAGQVVRGDEQGREVDLVLIVHGRVVGDDRVFGALEPLGRVRGEAQAAGGHPGRDKLVEAGLEQRRRAAAEPRHPALVGVDPDDAPAQMGEAGGGYRAQVPEADDADLGAAAHATAGSSFAVSRSTAMRTDSTVECLADQPSSRILVTSWK